MAGLNVGAGGSTSTFEKPPLPTFSNHHNFQRAATKLASGYSLAQACIIFLIVYQLLSITFLFAERIESIPSTIIIVPTQ